MGQGLELSRAVRFLRYESEQRAHYDYDARRHEGPVPQERPSGGLVGRLGARLVAQDQKRPIPPNANSFGGSSASRTQSPCSGISTRRNAAGSGGRTTCDRRDVAATRSAAARSANSPRTIGLRRIASRKST